MAKGKSCRSLSLKLLAMLLLAAMAAVALGLTMQVLGGYFIDRVYCAPSRRTQRLQATVSSFRTYVGQARVSSTDVVRIGDWNRELPYVRLTVYGNGSILSSDRWGAELVGSDNGLAYSTGGQAGGEGVYPVNFSDGACQVQFQDTSEERLYNILDWTSLIAGCLMFLALILLYNRQVTRSISRLAKQVRQVSMGDLTLEILPPSNDEIGGLAEDVDAMRLSIIDKLQREEAAWQANAELITAISHDVRTPLTTLMGYLDILGEGGDLTQEQQKQYLEVCRSKAEKLRELTNELFSYFLVFGKPEPELTLEIFDAETLLDQILGEQAADLLERGYTVRTVCPPLGGTIRVDVQHLRRVFDNLFSNVLKYADPAQPVVIAAGWEGEELHVTISNSIPAAAGRVESTKIGLQTCEKLLNSMGGRFLRHQTRSGFTAEVILPKVRGK